MEPAASSNFWDHHHHHHHIYFTVTRKVLAHRTGYHKTVKRQKEMLKPKYKKYKKNYEKHTKNTTTKKRSERRKHCALAVVRRSQKFSPRRRPLPGGAGRPKFNQLETVTTCTNRPSLVKNDARNFELSW